MKSTLQWRDARKEDPPCNGWYWVVRRPAHYPFQAKWEDGEWHVCDVECWAEIPTAERVRQKLRNERLKENG